MSALSITPLDREILDDAELARLEELLDFDRPASVGEWPHDHPPGASRLLERRDRDERDPATPAEIAEWDARRPGGRP